MCLVCEQPACTYGELCGKVKIYNTPGSATEALGREAEWEHVIPNAVISQSTFLNRNLRITYNTSTVYALDKSVHRDAMDGAGDGITSTGRSQTSQGWAKLLIPMFDGGCADEAVNRLFIDEVHAIKALKDTTLRFPYIASLGAVLHSYRGSGIITQSALDAIYKWVASELSSRV